MSKILVQINDTNSDSESAGNIAERMMSFSRETDRLVYRDALGNLKYISSDENLAIDGASKIGLDSTSFPTANNVKSALEELKLGSGGGFSYLSIPLNTDPTPKKDFDLAVNSGWYTNATIGDYVNYPELTDGAMSVYRYPEGIGSSDGVLQLFYPTNASKEYIYRRKGNVQGSTITFGSWVKLDFGGGSGSVGGEVINQVSTGVAKGLIITKLNDTQIQISSGEGYSVDRTDEANPIVNKVEKTSNVTHTIVNLASEVVFIFLDSSGNVVEHTNQDPKRKYDGLISLGAVTLVSSVIVEAVSVPNLAFQPMHHLLDLNNVLGIIRNGATLSKVNNTLNIAQASGYLFIMGGNYKNATNDPNRTMVAQVSPKPFTPSTPLDLTASATTTINVNQWWNPTTQLLETLDNNKWTIIRFYQGANLELFAFYGQAQYSTKDEAIKSVSEGTYPFQNHPILASRQNAIYLGDLIIQKSMTNLNNASIINADILGLNASGGASVNPVWGQITGVLSNQTDLQSALDSKQDNLPNGTNVLNYLGWSGTSWIARNIDYSEIQNTPTIPTNYVTTDSNQSSLSGTKSWDNTHTFGAGINVAGALASGNHIEVPAGGRIGNSFSVNGYLDINPNGVVLHSPNTNGEVGTQGGVSFVRNGVSYVDVSNTSIDFNSPLYQFVSVPTDTPSFYYGQNASGNLVKFSAPTPTTPTLQQVTTQGASTNVVSSFTTRLLVGGATDDLSTALQVGGNIKLTGYISNDGLGNTSASIIERTSSGTGSPSLLVRQSNTSINATAFQVSSSSNTLFRVLRDFTEINNRLLVKNVPTGTQQYLLAVDSSGNVIQGSASGGASVTWQFGRWFNSTLYNDVAFPPAMNWGDDGTGNPQIALKVAEAKTLKIVTFEAVINSTTSFDLQIVKNGVGTTIGSVTSASQSFTGLSISISAGDKIYFKATNVSGGATLKGVCIVAKAE